MDNEALLNLKGIGVNDDKLVVKTGFGCGCDITQEVANNSCKTQILDIELLKQVGGIELDTRQERIQTDQTGKNYSEMNHTLNRVFTGEIGLSAFGMGFKRTLTASLKSTVKQIDVYEYGMTMILQKMYSLNIKPSLLGNLKDFIGLLAWNEINATGEKRRTDKTEIKSIFKKYGTHITTKAFYGCMYQYFMCREQNDWESSMEKQLKIGSEAHGIIPETGITVDSKSDLDITNNDEVCYQYSDKVETIRRTGGNSTSEELKTWLDSCKLDDPNSNAMLGYVFNSPNEDSGLIPLYELLDKDDDRREAMKEAMEEYIKENSFDPAKCKMIITDVYAKHYNKGEKVLDYCYGHLIDGDTNNHRKYFKIDADIFDYVSGTTKGNLYFYYSLGHAIDEGIVDIEIMHESDPDGSEWIRRGCHANEGVTGCLDNNVLAIKRAEIKDGKLVTAPEKLISAFGVKVSDNLKISKGSDTKFNWKESKKSWYKGGLVHKTVKSVTSTDTLKEF